ncbi:MAG TPA: hypothetical protein VF743_01530, partial [Acidimicrobiales bacterium]
MTVHGGKRVVLGPRPTGLLDGLGARAERRAEPRLGVALAGVGMLVILVGILVWGGDSAASGVADSGEPDRTLGMCLSLAVIAVGYALLVRFRHGPLAAAGVVAAALGVPVLVGFATFDPGVAADPDVLLVLPIGVDAIVLVSLAAWLATYAWVPVARGRVFFLALSTFTLWLYVVEKVEEGAAGYLLTLPYSSLLFPFAYDYEDAPELPDPTAIGAASLTVGVLYYVAAVALDRRRARGAATPFVAAGFAASAVGIAHVAGDLEAIGTGLLLVLAGATLAVVGALHGRRFTTWVWAAGVGLGLLVVLSDVISDSAAGYGTAAIVLGAALVVVAHLLSDGLGEPDEMTPGPSRFTPPPGPTPSAPVPPWPYGPGPGPGPGVPPSPGGP